MVENVRGVFGKMLDRQCHRVSAAQYMRQAPFRGDNGLPWKQYQQEDQDSGFHVAQDIGACIDAQSPVGG